MSTKKAAELTTLVDGLLMPESPRWHQNRLWFVDMFAQRVMVVEPGTGEAEVVEAFDDLTGGLGFLPSGVLLVALKQSKKIVAIEDGRARVHADLGDLEADNVNDMVVTPDGRIYIDLITDPPSMKSGPRPRVEDGNDRIVLVDADGGHRVVASGMARPNGLAITPDGRELIVAETPAHRLRALSIDPADGSLAEPRLFVDTGAATPDGICLDAEGATWIGSPYTSEAIRILPSGEITHRIPVGDRMATACALGGDDRTMLFVTTVRGTPEQIASRRSAGFVVAAEVEIPGAGLP